jgi:uncharacterized protein YeaO (DUF488 family)
MAIRIVQLGTPRVANEGVRIGTVRRPPRGVPKAQFAARDFYDTWLPMLAPSVDVMKLGQEAQQSGNTKDWAAFERGYRREMSQPETSRVLDLFATLSHHTNLAVGCYCEQESRCHRSILRALLAERGAAIS